MAHPRRRRDRRRRPMPPANPGRADADQRGLPAQLRVPEALRGKGRYKPELVPSAVPEGAHPRRLGRQRGRVEFRQQLLLRQEDCLIQALLRPRHEAAEVEDICKWYALKSSS